MTVFTDALQGLLLGLSLIVAIGAQNAFVLRQGLRGEHLGAVVALCAALDALLIALGVFGSSWLQQRVPLLEPLLRYGGAAFLLAYGLLAWQRAWRPVEQGLQAGDGTGASLQTVLAQALAFTLLNPHVYLDTVILVGSVGAQQQHPAAFAGGASLGSLVWFVALGFAARKLAPWLRRPTVWRGIDALMGVLMIGLAMGLLA